MMRLPNTKQLAIGIVFVLLLGIGWAQFFSRDFSSELRDSALGQTLFEVFGTISESYIDEVNSENVLEQAIVGMVDSLEDPFSHYSSAHLALKEHQDLIGSYGGIGVVLIGRDPSNESIAEIVQVYKDSPAYNAGLLRGDIIYQVDGEDVLSIDADSIAIKLRGDVGTVVSLAVRRHGQSQLLKLALVRETIQVQSIETTILDNTIGYIRIYNFYNYNVYDQFKAVLQDMLEQQATVLIIDLRDNGGGLINQGVLIANELLRQKEIAFQRTRGITQRIARADNTAIDTPIIVLVNRNSASTAELLTASLKENNRVVVIGETTFGKGVGQTVSPLSDNGQLVLLNFEWLTPNRESINESGIQPDIVVKDTRRPGFINFEGSGAEEGQEIEIIIDGESAGKATINEDGSFDFYQTIDRRERSPVQGQALVDLDSDDALRTAYETVLKEAAN